MRFNPILTAVAGLLAGTVLAATGYAIADTTTGGSSLGSLSLSPGASLNVACPNNLGNTGVGPSSETVTCAPDTTTTTTAAPTTSTTDAPTTTTLPPTTTTAPTTTTTTAPPTTTTTAPPSSSTCTNPSYSTSQATGTENTDPNDGAQYWWVDNDAWSGSAGPQTIYVCNQSSWYAVSNQTNNQGQVETYPNTEYDVGGRANPSTKPISAYNSITSTFSEAFPTSGDSFDAGYDLWTNDWSNETMIWNQWGGTQGYWGQCAEPGPNQNDCVGSGGALSNSVATTLDGVPYHVLNLGGEVIFFRDNQVSSGSVDLLAAFNFEVSQGWAKASDVPTQLEYGAEICSTSGNQTFPLTGLTFNLS